HITILLVGGDLSARASLKRAATGLEGTVAVSFSGVQTYNREGIQRLRPLWEDSGTEVLLVEVPLALVQSLPEESWRRFKILSLRADMDCSQGHPLKDALIQNNEIWRLVRGTDPLKCPSCASPLVAEGLDVFAALDAIAEPTLETEQAVADMI